MCLITYQEKSTEVKEEMFVYKVMCVHNDGVWNSPYQGMEYIRDVLFEERCFGSGAEAKWSETSHKFVYRVHKGLHAYTSAEVAAKTCIYLNESSRRVAATYTYCVVKCRVPAKARQFISISGREICVNKLTPVCIVRWNDDEGIV